MLLKEEEELLGGVGDLISVENPQKFDPGEDIMESVQLQLPHDVYEFLEALLLDLQPLEGEIADHFQEVLGIDLRSSFCVIEVYCERLVSLGLEEINRLGISLTALNLALPFNVLYITGDVAEEKLFRLKEGDLVEVFGDVLDAEGIDLSIGVSDFAEFEEKVNFLFKIQKAKDAHDGEFAGVDEGFQVGIDEFLVFLLNFGDELDRFETDGVESLHVDFDSELETLLIEVSELRDSVFERLELGVFEHLEHLLEFVIEQAPENSHLLVALLVEISLYVLQVHLSHEFLVFLEVNSLGVEEAVDVSDVHLRVRHVGAEVLDRLLGEFVFDKQLGENLLRKMLFVHLR